MTMKRMIDKINGLSDSEQYQIFQIIRENKQKYTENLNGIFVNFNQLNVVTLQQIHHYIHFFEKQKQTLDNQNKLLESMETLVNGGTRGNNPSSLFHEETTTTSSTTMVGGDSPLQLMDNVPLSLMDEFPVVSVETTTPSPRPIGIEDLNEEERVISGLGTKGGKRDLSLNRLKPHYNGSSARIAKKCNYTEG